MACDMGMGMHAPSEQQIQGHLWRCPDAPLTVRATNSHPRHNDGRSLSPPLARPHPQHTLLRRNLVGASRDSSLHPPNAPHPPWPLPLVRVRHARALQHTLPRVWPRCHTSAHPIMGHPTRIIPLPLCPFPQRGHLSCGVLPRVASSPNSLLLSLIARAPLHIASTW